MKFRSPETGEVFDNIQEASHPFCARHSCSYNNCPLKGAKKMKYAKDGLKIIPTKPHA